MSLVKKFIKGLSLTPENNISSSIFVFHEMVKQGMSFKELYNYSLNPSELNMVADAMISLHAKYYVGLGVKGRNNARIEKNVPLPFLRKWLGMGIAKIGKKKLDGVFRVTQTGVLHLGKRLYAPHYPDQFRNLPDLKANDLTTHVLPQYTYIADVLDKVSLDVIPLENVSNSLVDSLGSDLFVSTAQKYRDTYISKDKELRFQTLSKLNDLGSIYINSNIVKYFPLNH